jgi:hypothetical protein
VDLSVAGLQQRLTPAAVNFLKARLPQAFGWFREQGRLPEAGLKPFSAVNSVASRRIELPAALRQDFPGTKVNPQPAELKLQLSFDDLSGTRKARELLAGGTPDPTSGLPTRWAKKDSLTVFDLGFFKKTGFEDIAEGGGYFISRRLTQAGVYRQPTAPLPLDWLTVLSARGAGSGEMGGIFTPNPRLKFAWGLVVYPKRWSLNGGAKPTPMPDGGARPVRHDR